MKTFLALAAVAAVLTIVRVCLVWNANLFQDEALYVWLGQKAPLNFCPHPPGVPLLTQAGLTLLGHSEIGVRLASLLLGALFVFPLYSLATQLGGRACGAWSVAAYACTPFFVAFGAIATPDMPQLFMFLLTLYCTWKALQANQQAWWAAAGLCVSVGLYFKYIIVLYFPSLLLLLVVVPSWRNYLRTPGPFLPGIIVLVMFVGVAVWSDSQTGWSAFRYHLKDRQVASGFSLENALVYHGMHFAYYSPLLYGIAVWSMIRSMQIGYRKKSPELLFLACFAIVPWLFFAVIALSTERDLSREQWDACAYIPAYIAAGILLQSREKKRRDLRFWAPAVGAITLAVLAVEIWASYVTRLLDRDPLFTRISGWRLLSRAVQKQMDSHFTMGGQPFVLADSFAPALELAFYSQNRYPVYSLPADRNARYGLNEVLEQTGLSVEHLQKEAGKNALILLEDRSRRGTVTSQTEALKRMFEQVEEKGRIPIFHNNRRLRVFRVFKGTALKQE